MFVTTRNALFGLIGCISLAAPLSATAVDLQPASADAEVQDLKSAVLDLNRAYNPWCAYCDSYTCPYVPPENWLSVPVRAGEKKCPRAE